MQRNKGFIDLDNYFLKKYGLSRIKDLVNENHVKEIDEKYFWFTIEQDKYMFKECYMKEECYIELISMKMLQKIGYDCAFYDLAKLNGMDGVITKDFKIEGHTYISGSTLIDEYYPEEISDNMYDRISGLKRKIRDHNNLEDIWNILEKRYDSYPNKRKIIENIMNDMVKRFLFYIITKQWDNAAYNWIIDETNDNAKLTPIFDNQKMLGLASIKKDKPVSLKVDEYNNDGNVTELKKLFIQSNAEVYNEFKRIYEILTPETLKEIIIEIENETDYIIDSNIKIEIIGEYTSNYNDLSVIFEEELSAKR